MKLPILVLAAFALSAGAAAASDMRATPASSQLICRWRATQQSGIPVQICLTRQQWAHRTAMVQQSIREYQARSFVHR